WAHSLVGGYLGGLFGGILGVLRYVSKFKSSTRVLMLHGIASAELERVLAVRQRQTQVVL
ncbi:MAG: hypothetical protein OXT67_00490, partial [Zetaproteobacteria bacterium]|nr:hypothetical protein [Zetaproteobacteria bacterium]